MTEIKLSRNSNGSMDCQLSNDVIDLDNDSYVALLQDAVAMLQAELLTAELQT
jgi:hypothetical protein